MDLYPNLSEPIECSELKSATEQFLIEAEQCSKYYLEKRGGVMGLATMTTAFAVVVTIGEILVVEKLIEKHESRIERPSDFKCIEAFCDESMNSEWLVQHKEPKQRPVEVLTEVRNKLTHALALPKGVVLLPTKEHYLNYPEGKIGIVPSLFVEAIRERVGRIFSKWSTSTSVVHNTSKGEHLPIIIDNYFRTTSSQGGSGNT
jgi:hypothetical protein